MNVMKKIRDMEDYMNELNNELNRLKRKFGLPEWNMFSSLENERYDSISDMKYFGPDGFIMVLKFINKNDDKPSFYILKGDIQKNMKNTIINVIFIKNSFTKIPIIAEESGIHSENLIIEISPKGTIYIVPTNANIILSAGNYPVLLEIEYGKDKDKDKEKNEFTIVEYKKINKIKYPIKDIIFDPKGIYMYILEVLDPRLEFDPLERIQTNKTQISRYTFNKTTGDYEYMDKIEFPKINIDWSSFLGWYNNEQLMVINNKQINLEKINQYGKPIDLSVSEKKEVNYIIKNNQNLSKNNQIIKFVSTRIGHDISDFKIGSTYRVVNIMPYDSVRIRVSYEQGKLFYLPQHFGKSNHWNLQTIFEPSGFVYTYNIKDIVIKDKNTVEKNDISKLKSKEIPMYFQKQDFFQ